jgi:hypothetical protein
VKSSDDLIPRRPSDDPHGWIMIDFAKLVRWISLDARQKAQQEIKNTVLNRTRVQREGKLEVEELNQNYEY